MTLLKNIHDNHDPCCPTLSITAQHTVKANKLNIPGSDETQNPTEKAAIFFFERH